jgi:hypothetical protein
MAARKGLCQRELDRVRIAYLNLLDGQSHAFKGPRRGLAQCEDPCKAKAYRLSRQLATIMEGHAAPQVEDPGASRVD